MLKYVNWDIVFQEVPDEVTLAINISNCPCHCKDCHSSYLASDIGTPLAWWAEHSKEEDSIDTSIDQLLSQVEAITCVGLMGGDAEPELVNMLAGEIQYNYGLKTAWYSGRQELSDKIYLDNFNYIKLGPYIPERGPLNNKNTNQKFYQVMNRALIDITYKFWKS